MTGAKQTQATQAGRLLGALRAAALAFAALAASSFAVAAPPAGTVISNTASATATTPGGPIAGNSNTVRATTSALAGGAYAATLNQSGSAVSAPGATVDFPHILSNVGTLGDTYTLAATDMNLGFSFASMALLPDVNGDGVADSNTPIAPNVGLAPGASFRFVLRVTVPATANATQQGDARVSATSAGGAGTLQNVDRVSLYSTVPLDCATASKFISADRGPSPGGPLTITLTYDACGKARQKVVLSDLLPAGMRYVPGSARWSGAPATPLTDADANDLQGPAGTQIAYDFGVTGANTVTATVNNLPVGGIGSITFQVEIAAGLAMNTVVTNGANYTFFDASGMRGVLTATNSVTYTVNGTADLELTGQRLPTATPGTAVLFTNVLTNKGNATDTFDITLAGSTFPAGTTFALFRPDGITPLADTDGNGTPDTGPVAPNATFNIIVRALIPSTALPGAYKVTKTARSARSPARTASADDAVDTLATKCGVVLDPDNQALAGFGRHVTYVHFLTNRGNCDEDVTATVAYLRDSRPGWTSAAFVDNPAAGGASVPGALDPTDTPVVPGWSARLAPGQGLRILIDVLAPTEAQMQALKAAGPKAVVDTNVTTLQLNATNTGMLAVRDTTQLDDQKADGSDTENTIRNYTDSSYRVTTVWVVAGRDAWLRANAPACNAVADVVESRLVVITGPNGEREEVTATETGPATGIFTVPALPVRSGTVVAGDRVLQGVPGTVFEVEVIGCGRRVSGVVTLTEPVSVVFDSRTNDPVGGATVTLVAATGGQCGTAAIGTPVTTDSSGRFTITATAGDYCLRVSPPNGYTAPSKVPYTQLTSGRNLDVSGNTTGGSYGTPFRMAAAGTIVVDIPVDAGPQDGLFVQKTTPRFVVELGEFVDYTVRVKNNTGNALERASVLVVDDLPAGFAYVSGTARRDKAPVADPVSNGPRLTLPIGTMTRGQEIVITYRVRVGPGALQGDGVNRVQASYTAGGMTTASNIATAKVQVIGGVFSERGFILGKVFLDCNTNGTQQRGEIGVPGVRLFIEDGTFVITDGEGKYSFYGLSNRTHTLKVDATTLPAGARLHATDARNLGSAGSRIVDLKAGELHRGDFAVAGCDAAVVEESKARAATLDQGADALAALAGTQLAHEARPAIDVKALPASGVVTTPAQPSGALPALNSPVGSSATTGIAQPMDRINPVLNGNGNGDKGKPANGGTNGSTHGAAPGNGSHAMPLEELLPSLDNTLGFVGLADGDVLPQAQASVRVKGTAGAAFKLSVNGVEVPESRVGKRSTLAEKQSQAWEYIGVELKPGANELTVAMVDQFGNARGTRTVNVKAAGKPAQLVIEVPAAGGVADGRSSAKVVVKVLDANGVPVGARVPVTLGASRGQWMLPDPDPLQEGLQAYVEGGRGEFALAAPIEPGASNIVAVSGDLRAEARLDFLPELRSLIATGVIEGIINARNISSKGLTPSREADGFEQELRHISREWNDGKGTMGARAAFFLKGKIKGDLLLTAAYDSDKSTAERLFRDIQPDEFYPVYGDSGIRGYDAQSTSKLYVRIDKNRSYLLWGDYTTAPEGSIHGFQRRLSNYSRSLTGAKYHLETDRIAANVFASRDTTRQVIDEFRANGTSGPYNITARGTLVNSEKIEIVIRDRNQPGIILKTTPQARFVDYEIDTLTGRILFRAPVASLDPDLNPVSIRVTYEIDQGGPDFWVAGGDVTVKVTDNIAIGASYVKDKNPLDPFEMAGAHAVAKITENTVVAAEFATTDRPLAPNANGNTKGDAARIDVKHRGKYMDAEAFVAKSDPGFDNQSASLSRGRSEAGAKILVPLGDKTRLRVEALRTEDGITDGHRDGAEAVIEHTFANGIRVEAGARHARETATPALPTYPNDLNQGSAGTTPNEVTSVRAKVIGPVPFVKDLSVFGELEVDVQDTDRKIAAVGGEYLMENRGRVYARHEFISSLTGPYGLNATQRQNSTIVGVDTEYMRDGKLFSEYRIRDAISGGDAEAAIGLRNMWTLAPGLRLGTNFERITALSGTGESEATAIALGIEYTANPLWKGTARLEVRDGHTSDSLLSTVGLAAKLSPDWTLLARNTYAITKNEGASAGEHTIDRMQAGVAYRDTETSKWNALARLEHRSEEDTTQPGIELKRTTELISVHADWKPSRPFLVTGRFAAKWSTDKSEGLSTKYRAQVVGLRGTWEFAPKWDVSLVTSLLNGEGSTSRHYGVGLELGYLLATNLWVSAGYNFFGYKDADLSGSDYTAKGPFVRVRYKFDEELLQTVGVAK